MPDAAILRPGERPMADRGGGARTIPLVTPACGSTQLLNGITIFAPGAAIGEHFHDCEESVMVLEGDAVAVLGGVEHRLQPGDTTWIPAGMPHYFRNASAEAEMRIFWTYASVRATRTMVATGETRPVAAEHAADKLIRR
ncbi:MAG: cupin domain-containing protein [Acetobacteraceae bacterium]|nr:cupin domain-containing protein [Acetobacteraceae bacterium]MCX7685789.1 cupin domain-containing protein [Acetobacteraceae bacterium]MDW8397262.1 cupin domain-containing protein [Acetobacteraceae bacterium]